jgi:hypothetical protein
LERPSQDRVLGAGFIGRVELPVWPIAVFQVALPSVFVDEIAVRRDEERLMKLAA